NVSNMWTLVELRSPIAIPLSRRKVRTLRTLPACSAGDLRHAEAPLAARAGDYFSRQRIIERQNPDAAGAGDANGHDHPQSGRITSCPILPSKQNGTSEKPVNSGGWHGTCRLAAPSLRAWMIPRP